MEVGIYGHAFRMKSPRRERRLPFLRIFPEVESVSAPAMVSLLLLLPAKLNRLPSERRGLGLVEEGEETGDLAREEDGDGIRPPEPFKPFVRCGELNGDAVVG